jgi:hypothetical protein
LEVNEQEQFQLNFYIPAGCYNGGEFSPEMFDQDKKPDKSEDCLKFFMIQPFTLVRLHKLCEETAYFIVCLDNKTYYNALYDEVQKYFRSELTFRSMMKKQRIYS